MAKPIGKLTGTFHVPAYQRGYRWTDAEVKMLLNDIRDHWDQDYFLQPIVVKRRGHESARDWDLVDGQQRLTTLFLIFQYLSKPLPGTGPAYWLVYETRRESELYLRTLDRGRRTDNIDFFHIYAAYECIETWFANAEHAEECAARKFYTALRDRVHVIWYEAPADVDSAVLFTNLNAGRIHLTPAELVKAQLLSRSEGEAGADWSRATAAEWDGIEHDLRDPERWAFITRPAFGKVAKADDPNHISLLLDTLADAIADEPTGSANTFETLKPCIIHHSDRFWTQIVELHSLVLWWHDDLDLFHKIGFLTCDGATSFRELVDGAQNPKADFANELDERIRRRLKLSESQLRELRYDGDKPRAYRAVLLMNVETVRQRKLASERYSFSEYAKRRWSLEHIHAQDAEPLRRQAERRDWLRFHAAALKARDSAVLGITDTDRDRLLDRVARVLSGEITRDDFLPLARGLVESLSLGEEGGHSISNLALLEREDNSALKNSVFAAKRSVILDRDREGAHGPKGSYVPPCTRNVFLKCYSPEDGLQMTFWSEADRSAYMDEMVRVLDAYLLPEDAGP